MTRLWCLAAALLLAASPLLAQPLPDLDPLPSLYEVPGQSPNRDYVNQHLVERIDPFSGKLQLDYVDLFIPGNGGFDLKVRRSYSSVQADRGPGEPGPWGVGWTMSFGRVLRNSTTNLCHFGLSQRLAPVLEMPGGQREILHDAPNAGIYFITKSRYKGVCASGGLGMHVFAPDGTRYDFTHQGLPVGSPIRSQTPWLPDRIEDRNGNWMDFTYQRFPLWDAVSTITTSDGRSLEFTYQDTGLESITTNDGRTVTYEMRPLPGWFPGTYFLLDSVVRPDGLAWSYLYDETVSINQASDYNLTQLRYPTGGTLDYSYDFVNFYYDRFEPRTSAVIEKRSSDGGVWTLAYRPGTRGWQDGDEQGDPDSLDRTTIDGPTGTTTYWHYGYAAASTVPLSEYGIGIMLRKRVGTLQEEGYVWAPQLISNQLYVHINGLQTFGAYAPVLEVGGLVRDGALYETTYGDFDDYGNPQTIVEASGGLSRTTTIGYAVDTVKWLLRLRETERVDTIPGILHRQFDTSGNVLVENRYGVATGFTYHSTGDLRTRTDARNQTVTFEDYVRGVPERELYPEGVTLSREVSSAGNIEEETDGEGRTTSYDHDGLNRLIRAEHELGAPVTVEWLANTRTLRRGPYLEVITFDGFGRTTHVASTDTVRAETIEQRTSYNAGGQKTFQSYPGSTSEGVGLVLDQLDRLRQVTYDAQTRRRHDFFGLDTLVTDERGIERLYRYRAFGNPDQRELVAILTQDQGADTEITRNGLGQVTAIDQGGVVRTFDYDTRYFLVSQTEPETGTTLFGRDDVGNMVSRQVGSNPAATFTYDGLSRLRTETYPAGTPAVTREYYRDGKLRSVDNGSVRREYTYDENRNPQSETLRVDGLTLSAAYEYDGNDALSALVYGTTTRIEYAPDAFGRPTRATPFVTSVEHHPYGGPRRWVHANGVVNEMTLSPRRWPERLTAQGAQSLLDQTYVYDAVGNLRTITDAADPAANRSLGYDLLDRLVTVAGPWGNGVIDYDGRGNLLFQQYGSYRLDYTYEPGTERLVTITGPRSYTLSYDSYGNVTSREGAALAWDHASRLQCVRCGQPDEIRYSYDGGGARVASRTAGGATYFFHAQGGDLLYEQTPGVQLKEYVYLGGRLVAERLQGAASPPLVTEGPATRSGTATGEAASGSPPATSAGNASTAAEEAATPGPPRSLRALVEPMGQEKPPPTGVEPPAPETTKPDGGRYRLPDPDSDSGFEPNVGQWEAPVLYRALGRGEELRIDRAGATLSRTVREGAAREDASSSAHERVDLRLRLVGARPPHSVEGEGLLAARSHYYLGERPSDWHTNVPRYQHVRLRDVYPGVDQVFYRRDGRFEYDLVVAPGADPSAIALAFEGAAAPTLSPQGDLLVATAAGEVRQSRPLAYQQIGKELRRIDARYVPRADGSAAVSLGAYDATAPLVIDPSFGFSTYLGNFYDDYGVAVASDPAGNLYVAGVLYDFVGVTATVTKLSPTGQLLWRALLGSFGHNTQATAVATDAAGNVYVAGVARSGWPITEAAFQPTPAGHEDATLVQLSPDGDEILFGSYLGGSGYDEATAIAVDGSGRIYLAGRTDSTDFPVRDAFQAECGGDCALGTDAFFARIAAGGATVDYASYLGGQYTDWPAAIVARETAGIWLAGKTASPDFPVASAHQATCAGGCADDAFVTRFASDGRTLVYSTFLGSIDPDAALALAVDSQGSAYIAGYAGRSLPAVELGGRRPDAKPEWHPDSLLAKFSDSGVLAYSVRFPAAGELRGVAVGPDGRAHVAGRYAWPELEWQGALQPYLGDLFVATVDAAGTSLEFATPIAHGVFPYGTGGLGGLARTPNGSLVIAGSTLSNVLPMMFATQPEPGSFQVNDSLERSDMFVILLAPEEPRLVLGATPDPAIEGEPVTLFADLPGATGEALFFDGRTEVGRARFFGGQAQLQTTLQRGTRNLYALYPGDGFEPRAASNVVPLPVRGLVAIELDVFPPIINEGEQVGLHATVWDPGGTEPTGTVVFKERQPQVDVIVGTTVLPQNRLDLSPTAGVHTYYIQYSGDDLHAPGTSVDAGVRVRARPRVTIDAPAPGTRFSPQDTVAVRVAATTSDTVRIRYVDLYVDGQLKSRRTAPPFRFSLDLAALGIGIGTHVLQARAVDAKGGLGQSALVPIEVVGELPQVSWLKPAAGATLPAAVGVLLEVNAVSPLGRPIARVDFFANGQPVGSRTAPPWALLVSLSPGAYTLGATATDNQDLAGSASARSITVTAAGAAAVTYIHTDPAGSPIAATDAAGQLLWRESYRPYGERLRRLPASQAHRQFFHGKPEDSTGLQYFGARYYDPYLGRFLSVDPAPPSENDIHSPNRYAYGNSSPYVFKDPDGRWPSFFFQVHQRSIDRALGFLPESDRKILRDVQTYADRFQKIEDSTRHAQDSPYFVENEGNARVAANNLVRDWILAARAEQDYAQALFYVGLVIHALQDATSPAHAGFTHWDGNWNLAALAHLMLEFFDPGAGSHLDAATRLAWEYFTGARALPDDFFEGLGVDQAPVAQGNEISPP